MALRVRVRLFAALAERAGGRREVWLELPGKATALDAWEALERALGSPLNFPRQSVRVAVNLVYAPWERVLADGDEVAFIPPVAGGNGAAGRAAGAAPVRVILTAEPLGADAVVDSLVAPEMGAIAVFVGAVREWTAAAPGRSGGQAGGQARRTLEILYEAYDEMARREMDAIGREVTARWPGARVVLAHRTGLLRPGDVSLVIAVAAPHRAPAFEAVRWATDELKKRVPIWKKERYEDGEEWVGLGA